MLRRAIESYEKASNTRIVSIFAIAALIVVGLSWLYFHFIGRKHPDTFLLRYLVSLVMLLGGIAFVVLARLAADPFQRLAYGIFGVFLLVGAIVSFITTLILFALA